MTNQTERLPAGWAVATIDDIATVNPPKPDYSRLKPGAAIGFVPMSAVDAKSGRITEVKERALSEVRDKSYRGFVSRDILFAKITPCMENGKSAIVPELPNDIGFGSTEFHVLRSAGEVDPTYLWRFIRQDSYRKDAEAHMTGSVGQLRVPVDFVRSSNVPLPPVSEQRRIVQRLDEIERHRASVDMHLQVARHWLERLRSAVLAAACSGRLTEDWREDHPNTTIDQHYAELIKAPQTARVRQAAASDEPGLTSEVQLEFLPSSWSLVRLGDILKVSTGATPLRKNQAFYDGGTIPWVTSGAVNAGTITSPTELITPLALEETNVKLFPPGTLLVAMYGEGQTRGRVAELAIEAGTNQAVAAVLFTAPTAPLKPFVRLFFEDSYRRVRALSVGGVQPNLNLGMIKDTLLPLPPREEQDEIVRRAAVALDTADRLSAQIEQTQETLDSISRTSLVKAFRGELVPTEAALAAEEGRDFESGEELPTRVMQ